MEARNLTAPVLTQVIDLKHGSATCDCIVEKQKHSWPINISLQKYNRASNFFVAD